MISVDYIRKLTSELKPSMAYEKGMNVYAWQREAKKKLEELLGLPLGQCHGHFRITGEKVCEGYTQYDFTFQSEPGYYVPCALLAPDNAAGPLPVAICLQGHSTGMHISLGETKFPKDQELIDGGRDFAVRAVKEGFYAIAMEQRYMGSCGGSESGSPACSGSVENASMPSLLLGRTAVGERVWDVMRLIDVIEEELTPYIDKDKIILMGNSGGGTVTFYASCMDERIALAMPSCAVCTYDDSIIAMNHCPCNYIPGIRRYFNMGDLGVLVAPRPFVLVCGEKDPIFPINGVKESFATIKSVYESMEKSENCRLVIGNGGHQFYPDDAWPVAKKLLE